MAHSALVSGPTVEGLMADARSRVARGRGVLEFLQLGFRQTCTLDE